MVTAGTTVVRGERTRLIYKTESTFGSEDLSMAWRRFGITHGATCPDPDYQYEPQWITGEGRDWKFMPGEVKEVYAGSMPDVWLQQAQIFKYILGGCISPGGGAENTISVATTLPSFTWEVSDWDDTATGSDDTTGKVLLRRYLGCKINRASIAAEEGGRLQLSLEEILCQNLIHDQAGIRKYSAGMVAHHVDPYAYQPYLFHEGQLQLFGVTFAQVKRFNLTMVNGLEPQYFIQRGASEPYPYSIVEHRTGFACTATINVTDVSMWNALMAKNCVSGAFTGFTGLFDFYRGGVAAGDYISLQLGPDGALTVINPGCFFKKGGTKAVETPLIPVDVEVEVPTVVIRSKDSYGQYNT